MLSNNTSNFIISGRSSNRKNLSKRKKKLKGLNFDCDKEVESLLVATHIQ